MRGDASAPGNMPASLVPRSAHATGPRAWAGAQAAVLLHVARQTSVHGVHSGRSAIFGCARARVRILHSAHARMLRTLALPPSPRSPRLQQPGHAATRFLPYRLKVLCCLVMRRIIAQRSKQCAWAQRKRALVRQTVQTRGLQKQKAEGSRVGADYVALHAVGMQCRG